VDGASHWYAYRHITLPLLRPAFAVATVINLMNVFNSFPIIWEMTRGGPGYETSTSTVFMYDLKGTFVGQSAAMSIINFALVVLIILAFLRVNGWNREGVRLWRRQPQRPRSPAGTARRPAPARRGGRGGRPR
jgi:ABC-type sugar transport system permease subunit